MFLVISIAFFERYTALFAPAQILIRAFGISYDGSSEDTDCKTLVASESFPNLLATIPVAIAAPLPSPEFFTTSSTPVAIAPK